MDYLRVLAPRLLSSLHWSCHRARCFRLSSTDVLASPFPDFLSCSGSATQPHGQALGSPKIPCSNFFLAPFFKPSAPRAPQSLTHYLFTIPFKPRLPSFPSLNSPVSHYGFFFLAYTSHISSLLDPSHSAKSPPS